MLELLLFYARPRCDTNQIAHELLKHFGSVAAVMDAPIEELSQMQGMGEKSAMLLKMIPELCGYYLSSRSAAGDVLDSTERAGQYLMPRFFGKTNEEVWLVALDDKRKVLRCVKVGEEGVVNAVRITVRNVVAEAVKANATAIIIAHNHPGGLALPSAADKQLTRQLYQALKYISITLLDHIVVADGDFVSMADSGYLELISREEFL